jgi:phospholipid/cholesterol/gamma-HCH transport system substrate-binding protein
MESGFPRVRRRIVSIMAAAVVIVLVVALALWWHVERRPSVRFDALFSTTVGVYPGSDVRMLGVGVGKVDSVTPIGTQVRVSMHLNRGMNAAADTGAVILSPSLVSDRYVQLTGLYTSGAKLANGTTIPTSRTATPVELDQLYNSINQLTTALGPAGANANGALSDLIDTGAANLAGNGKAFNDTVNQLSKATSVFADSKDNLFATIDNLKNFTTMLAKNNTGVQQVNQQLASVSQLLSDDRQSFAAALNQLGTALGSVSTFISENRGKLKSNVDKLSVTSQLLVKQRASLRQMLQSVPLALQNLINAYDPTHGTLNGRADLNELDQWGASSSVSNGSVSPDSAGAPPLLLPGTNGGSK